MSKPIIGLLVSLLALGCTPGRPPAAASEEGPSGSDTDAEPPREDTDCPCRSKEQAAGEAGDASAVPHAAAHMHGAEVGIREEASPHTAHVVSHAELRAFENNGNTLVGIATRSLGATTYEVWRTSIAVGSKTPVHRHGSEEVFVVLEGSGIAHVGDRELPFAAPATVIAPAGVPHYIENTGTVPTDSIVIVGLDSDIKNAQGASMELPWRH